MRRNRFVKPNVVRLPISENDWIDVKQELNAGEERRVFFSQVQSMTLGERATLNPAMVGKAQMVEYLLGWSFTEPDEHGEEKPVAYTASALDSLDSETFNEIRIAVEAHDAAIEARREERKNKEDGESSSSAISPSVS